MCGIWTQSGANRVKCIEYIATVHCYTLIRFLGDAYRKEGISLTSLKLRHAQNISRKFNEAEHV